MSPHLVHSFAKHRGVRGVHFYDGGGCEFFRWDDLLATLGRSEFPEVFRDKLVEAVANYDPDAEFIAVSAGGGQLTIEMFKALTM